MKQKLLLLLISIATLASLTLNSYSSEKNILIGKVLSESTSEVIPGATIRIEGTNIGTYSSSRGFFKLKLPSFDRKIRVSSLGYESNLITVKQSDDTLIVKLKESSVKKKSVTVIGDIEPNEVIKRAIERKQDNLSKLKTFQGTLYSKLSVELDGSIMSSIQGNSISISTSSNTDTNSNKKYKMFLLETFSNVMQDYEKNVRQTAIIQRRQTSNIKANENILAIGNFLNLYNDKIKVISTEFTTPLAEDALSYYKFKIIEKTLYDEKYVYVIEVIPDSRLFPTFIGTIKLLEGDYNLVEADLKPSENSAVPFMENMTIHQKFSESVEKIWYPSYLYVSGKAKVDVVKGLVDLKASIEATSIYSDVAINKPLPDSIYVQEKKRITSVAKDADSAKTEFWENNSLREISEKEKSMYAQIDSIVVKDSLLKNDPPFSWNYNPYLSFNRVGSVSLGLSLSFSYHRLSLYTTPQFSFGLQKPLGTATLEFPLIDNFDKSILVNLNIFSKLGRVSQDDSYIDLLNTAMSSLCHYDYYDYAKFDGWGIKLINKFNEVTLNAGVDFFRIFSLGNTTNTSIFSKNIWRKNPAINAGDYIEGNFEASYGLANFMIISPRFENEIYIKSNVGYSKTDSKNYFMLQGKYKTSIPTFKTGYMPMKLNLIIEGGICSVFNPVQNELRMESSMFFINKFGNFLTAQPAEYGGKEYFAFHGGFNTSDMWWRFAGLPLYEGRGIDLILCGSFGRFFSDKSGFYKGTGNQHYSEVGFGLSRIPTFFSNVIFAAFDARWGIGPVSNGNFGWSVSASLPF